ncbi:MAG: tetratricopeptide repeat protein [Haliscomenobacter sp.]|uniref:tetratricopeptide repeat protein n=1 Tax=Haliscomenobacter sp. TaxID=2717303 RepID=UPI0029AA8530|nr:tetratricopeptide repeat protein [Haliscomenobacter sp.]MDX2070030.1 tetratricopeptide repeat protein [Haliscomenobacter sp.]
MSEAEQIFTRAETFRAKGALKKAIKYYRQATEKDDSFVDAFNVWGNILYDLEKYDEAKEKYERCIKIDPNYKWAYYNLGLIYKKTDPKKAMEYYQQATEKDDSFVDAFNVWGNVLYDLEKYDEAKEKYERCIKVDPSYKWAYYNLGQIYKKTDPKKAMEYYQQATEKDDSYVDAFNEWGNILYDLEKYNEAKEIYERCIKIDINYKWAYYNLGQIYKKTDSKKAMEYYQQATEKDDSYVNAFYAWGDVLYGLEKYEEARKKYEKCLKMNPGDKRAYYRLGSSFVVEDPLQAIQFYQKAIEYDKEDKDAYNSITHCIPLIKDYKESVEQFQNFVYQKNTAAGFWALGNLYQYFIKDYDKALENFEKSISIGDVKGMVLDYSNLYDSTGNLEKSIEILNNAIFSYKSPDNIHIKHNKAHYLLKMGQYEKSRELWKEVLNQYEDALKKNMEFKSNIYNYLYCGAIYHEIFGNFEMAEKTFKAGIEVDKKNIELMVALNRLYSDKEKREIGSTSGRYWQRNLNLSHVEKLFNRLSIKPEEYYYQMAELYYIEEIFDKSQLIIEEYFALDKPQSFRWFNLKGQLFLAKEEYANAINSFKSAIKLESHNLDIRNNLANAYLINKNYSEAELEFRKILRIDTNNVDALIGLGEINLNYSSDDTDDLLLDTAEKYLLDALKIGTSTKGSKQLNLYELTSKKNERKYKDLKLSDLYYSIGYIKIKKYKKSKPEIRNTYLNESLNYFIKSQKCNPDNLKATTARNKIENYVQSNQKENRSERFNSWLVTGLAFILFLFCQYFFYVKSSAPEKFTLNQVNVSHLTNLLSLNDKHMHSLEKLAGISFEDKNTLLKAIELKLGTDLLQNKKELIEKMILTEPKLNESSEFIPVGYYVLISFGAIIFMIAGLYLPKLLKLKVGVIEIEKNSLSEIYDFSLLGIQK